MHLIHLIIHIVRVSYGQGLTFNLILVCVYNYSISMSFCKTTISNDDSSRVAANFLMSALSSQL